MPKLSRHDSGLRVPRYTSYPTAAQFSDAVDSAAQATWLAASGGRAISIYAHVPFCHSLCHYCACHTVVVQRQEVLDRYAALLIAEADLVRAHLAAQPRPIALQWGGGTPTHLGPKLFRETAEALLQRFPLVPGAEHATEIDPRRCGGDLAEALAQAGITRVSLGVQDFAPEVQEAIGRLQSLEETRQAVTDLRAVGIAGLNLDLVFGLPRQDLTSLRRTLEQAIALTPDRLAVFGYAHVPWMKRHQCLIPTESLPGAALREEMALLIDAVLLEAGYRKIGLDHYALPHDPLAKAAEARQLRRSFQGYSDQPAEVIVGLGASAISTLPDGLVQNVAGVRAWQQAIAAGRLAGVRGVALDPDERLRAAVIEGLMCNFEVDVAALAAAEGLPAESLGPAMETCSQLAAEGLVQRQDWVLRVPETERRWVRLVAAAFDRHWMPENQRHAPAI
ncbi:MAG: oxygen-independent coproporphyrinogen III oxidase [Rhodospirillales bacterium]